MVKKTPGAYWTDEEIKQAIDEWKKKRPDRLKTGEWKIEDIPFYEPGMLARVDLWHRVDYSDELEITWGKNWGASGIGKLREGAVCRITEWMASPFIQLDSLFIARGRKRDLKDWDKWQKEYDGLLQVLQENGVIMHNIEHAEVPIGPYGPLDSVYAPGEALMVWGGAIVPRFGGFSPIWRGRETVITQWLAKQGCPILLTIMGKGVGEVGNGAATMPIADDCILIGQGMAFNQEGIDQITPVLHRAGITEIVEVRLPGWVGLPEWPTTISWHLNMFMHPLDLGKVLVYPPLCGWETIKWFRDRGWEIIEISADELRTNASNIILLGPGKALMMAHCKEAIKKVRKAGVEVIEVPWENVNANFGGFECLFFPLIRDRGPKLADIK